MSKTETDSIRSNASAWLVRAIARAAFRPIAERADTQGLWLRAMRAIMFVSAKLSMPSHSAVEINEVSEDFVHGEWIRPRTGNRDAVVLYVHGGGYVLSSPESHRTVTVPLAVFAGAAVFSVRYRRAPENKYPRAFDDVLAAYNWLLTSGVPPNQIVLAGDSIGGHLIATMLLAVVANGGSIPAGVVLFSPWLSLDPINEQALDTRRDPLVSPRYSRRCARAYLGDVRSTDPRVAPLLAPSELWQRFPPMMIVFGATECMRDVGRHLHERLISLGVPSELHEKPGQIHGFVLLARWLPEGKSALREAARFITAVAHADDAMPTGA